MLKKTDQKISCAARLPAMFADYPTIGPAGTHQRAGLPKCRAKGIAQIRRPFYNTTASPAPETSSAVTAFQRWAISSAVEHCLHTAGVASSNLASPTSFSQPPQLLTDLCASPASEVLRQRDHIVARHCRYPLRDRRCASHPSVVPWRARSPARGPHFTRSSWRMHARENRGPRHAECLHSRTTHATACLAVQSSTQFRAHLESTDFPLDSVARGASSPRRAVATDFHSVHDHFARSGQDSIHPGQGIHSCADALFNQLGESSCWTNSKNSSCAATWWILQ